MSFFSSFLGRKDVDAVAEKKIEDVYETMPRLVAPVGLPVDPTPGPTGNEQLIIDSILEHKDELLKDLPQEPNDSSPRFDAHAWLDEHRILLYVRANKGNIEQARTRLRNTLEWHCTYRPHAITPSSMQTEGATGKQYVNGFDKSGRPLIYMYSHKQNTKDAKDHLRYVVFTMEQALRSMPKGVSKVTMVIDVSKYSMSQAVPLSTAREFLHVLESHYPERLHKALVLQPPMYFVMFYKIVAPFIDPVTKDKIAFIDTSGAKGKSGDGTWANILDFVEPGQLQTDAGGEWTFKYEQNAMHSQDSRIERSACDSGSDSDRSDAIDSDVEERILSHLYYQSNEAATAAPDQSNDADTPVDQQSLPSNSADAAPTNGGKTKSDTLKVDPSAAATHTVTSDTMTPSKPFATLALTSPVESDMEKQTMRIALHEPQTSDSIVHTVSTKRPRDEENEYDYLDEAEIQGHNRYFMEEKETICRKCHRGGHIAKDCTTVVCMICGKDDHSAKNCKQTGVVCHGCNMRGHLMSECPQRKGERNARPRACERCGSHKHHTDECSNIWRKYVYNVPPPLKYNT
ncbi:hypothetical protein GGH16_002856, partial [Coemansia sp. RSA 560]